MVIYPEVIVTPDTPTVRFHQPRDKINLQDEIPRILHAQGWNCGTYFNVQFLNHEKTKLLACGRFVVTEDVQTLQTNHANAYQPMTKTVFSRRAEQIGEWWVPPSYELKAPELKAPGEITFIEPDEAGKKPSTVTAEPAKRKAAR